MQPVLVAATLCNRRESMQPMTYALLTPAGSGTAGRQLSELLEDILTLRVSFSLVLRNRSLLSYMMSCFSQQVPMVKLYFVMLNYIFLHFINILNSFLSVKIINIISKVSCLQNIS